MCREDEMPDGKIEYFKMREALSDVFDCIDGYEETLDVAAIEPLDLHYPREEIRNDRGCLKIFFDQYSK